MDDTDARDEDVEALNKRIGTPRKENARRREAFAEAAERMDRDTARLGAEIAAEDRPSEGSDRFHQTRRRERRPRLSSADQTKAAGTSPAAS
jgi:hypothetical protein